MPNSNYVPNDRIVIDHTRFIFQTNFAGDASKDRFGSSARQANVIIPDPEMAMQMRADGYHVRETQPRQDDDPSTFEPEYYVKVTLKYVNRQNMPVRNPPIVKLISGKNPPADISEEGVSLLDNMRLKDVRLVLSGYPYNDNGDRALTIKTMYVTQNTSEDPFAQEYMDADDEDLPF